MVNIYLLSNHDWIHGLTIPLADVQRLSIYPLKWLRFVAFAVVGAKGHLSETPGGNVVDYEFTDLDDNNNYYFIPEGDCHLVDAHALDDDITSSTLTQRRADFRQDVSRRDGDRCAVTGAMARVCDATHIIPHSKGDEYIRFVITDRRHLYEDQQLPAGNNIDINSIENGILLRKDLHAEVGDGYIGFLKTPNFALSPADIPSREAGKIPDSRTTTQYIEIPDNLYRVEDSDVLVDWSSPDAPSRILLDYMYGAAVIKHWPGPSEDINPLLEDRHQNAFRALQPPARSPVTPEDEIAEQDPTDGDYMHPRKQGKKAKESKLCEGMDKLFRLSMVLRGYSPETTFAEMRKKQKEEAKLRSRQVMQEKVERWLPTVEASVPTADEIEQDFES